MGTPDQKEGKHFGVTRELQSWYRTEKAQVQAGPGERIKDRVAKLMPELIDWQKRFSLVMVASRLERVAQAVVVPYPSGTFEEHLLLCKLGLVDFALDDVADGEVGALTDEEIHQSYERYAQLAVSPQLFDSFAWTGADAASARTLGSALQEVARELRDSPGAERFLPLWQEHFQRFCKAHRDELQDKRRYQEDGTLPSLEDYLSVGQWSCGASMYCSAVLVVRNPPDSQAQGPLQDPLNDPSLAPLIESAFVDLTRLVRWLNDVRSLERERAEGKFNSLTLLMKSGMSEKEAEREAVTRGTSHLESLRQHVREFPAELEAWGRMLVNLAEMSRTLYLRRDFHD